MPPCFRPDGSWLELPIDLSESPELLEKAKAEHAARVGDGYVCPIPAGVKPHPMGAKK